MKPKIPHLGFIPENLAKILLDNGFLKAEIKPANPISHIQDDGKPEFYERFSIYAEAPYKIISSTVSNLDIKY